MYVNKINNNKFDITKLNVVLLKLTLFFRLLFLLLIIHRVLSLYDDYKKCISKYLKKLLLNIVNEVLYI